MRNFIVPLANNTGATTFQTYATINGAQARGIILQAIQHFRFLPAPFDGLGVDANLTLVDATGNVVPRQGRSALPEAYPITFNVTETFDRGPFHAELLESYTSKNIFTVGATHSTMSRRNRSSA